MVCPPVPVLPGRAPQLRLADAPTGRSVRWRGSKTTIRLRDHALRRRIWAMLPPMLTFDLIHRLAESRSWCVRVSPASTIHYLSARIATVSTGADAQAEVALFCEDMAALRVLPPQDCGGHRSDC